MKYWEIIADRLYKQGWSYGIVEYVTPDGRRWCVDAYKDGKKFIVKSDELLTIFLMLEKTLLGDFISARRESS